MSRRAATHAPRERGEGLFDAGFTMCGRKAPPAKLARYAHDEDPFQRAGFAAGDAYHGAGVNCRRCRYLIALRQARLKAAPTGA